MLTAVSFVGFAAGNTGGADAALGTIVLARHNIDAHFSQIQKKNSKLLRLSADELASASFDDYDTSGTLIGSSIVSFDDSKVLAGSGTIENVLSREENRINTIAAGKYTVASLQEYGKYAGLFQNSTVLRAPAAKRASLVCDYGDDVPSYQIIKDKKNVYVENIDFSKFPTIKFENSSNIIFNNCTFTDFLDNALVFRNCNDISILNCTFTDCGSNVSDATNGGYSIRIAGDEDVKSKNILIENCKIEHSYGKSISLVGSVDNYIIRNNTINNSVWAAIDYWYPSISGEYANIVENNVCTNVGFGTPAADDRAAKTCGVGCAAIFAGKGEEMPCSIVKNNTVKNVVETAIEGPYEVVYHNTVKNSGERSTVRVTGSTEAVYIKPVQTYEQKYIGNTIETRGLRCFSSYSAYADEYKAIYIMNNHMNLKKEDPSITYNYTRSDVEVNCKHLKKLVISGNDGMRQDEVSVNIVLDPDYKMDYFDLDNPCKIGNMPQSAKYCFNINNGQFS